MLSHDLPVMSLATMDENKDTPQFLGLLIRWFMRDESFDILWKTSM